MEFSAAARRLLQHDEDFVAPAHGLCANSKEKADSSGKKPPTERQWSRSSAKRSGRDDAAEGNGARERCGFFQVCARGRK